MNPTTRRSLAGLFLAAAAFSISVPPAGADQPPGQLGYEGQPGNQGNNGSNGQGGYEGQPGNQGGH